MRTSQNTLVGILLGMVALAALGVIALLVMMLQRDQKPVTPTTVTLAESAAQEKPVEPQQPKIVDPEPKSNERELPKTGELTKGPEAELTKLVEVEVPTTRKLPKGREIVDEVGVRVFLADDGKIKQIKQIPEVSVDKNHASPTGRTTTVQTSDDKRTLTVTKTSKDGKKVNMTVMLPALDDTSGPVTFPLGEWMKDDEQNFDDFVDESEPVELEPIGDTTAPLVIVIPTDGAAAPKVVVRSNPSGKRTVPPVKPIPPPAKIDSAKPMSPEKPVALTIPTRQEKAAIRDGDTMEAFFKAQPATVGKAPSLDSLKGKWQVKVTRIDLGPGVPTPDVAEVKPFTFSIEDSGGGLVLKPETGKGAARTLIVGASGIVARAADRSDMSLQVADGALKGSLALPDSGRLEFHATRLP